MEPLSKGKCARLFLFSLFLAAILHADAAIQTDPEADPAFRGISYASWTGGEYPYTTSWKPQTFTGARAVASVEITNEKSHSGQGSLALTVRGLSRSDPDRQSGEAFVDLRYHPPLCEQPEAVSFPLNMCGKVLSAWVYCETGSAGDPAGPNGLQLFAKDRNWKSYYGTWKNIDADMEGKWQKVTMGITAESPPGGYMDPDFDCGSVIVIGLKIGAGGRSAPAFSGTIWLDGISWGEKEAAPEYGFDLIDDALTTLGGTGANAVSLIVTGYMDRTGGAVVYADPVKTHPDSEVVRTIEEIKRRGMMVLLKPHVDVQDQTWRGYIDPEGDAVETWFESYIRFISRYARMAESTGVDMFCVGTEFASLDSSRACQPHWYAVIDSVRHNYRGPLVYAANWDGYRSVTFWDALDFAGIDAYFPLSDAQHPSLDTLIEGWFSHSDSSPHHWVEEIQAWQSGIGKPVIFTEIGYGSRDFSAKEPWLIVETATESPSLAPPNPLSRRAKIAGVQGGGSAPNPELQKRCYEAAFRVWSNVPWFQGTFWWMWHPYADAGGLCNYDFTPQNKPAEAVLKSPPTDPPREIRMWSEAGSTVGSGWTIYAEVLLNRSPQPHDSTTTVAFSLIETPPIPDFDGNGTVEFTDFLMFARAFGGCDGTEAYDPAFDLNGDGCINFPDFLMLAKLFQRPVEIGLQDEIVTVRGGVAATTLMSAVAGTVRIQADAAAAKSEILSVDIDP